MTRKQNEGPAACQTQVESSPLVHLAPVTHVLNLTAKTMMTTTTPSPSNRRRNDMRKRVDQPATH